MRHWLKITIVTMILAPCSYALAQQASQGACERNCGQSSTPQYGYGKAPATQFQYGKPARRSSASSGDCDGYPLQTRGSGGPPGTVCRCTLGGPMNPETPGWWAVRPGSDDGDVFHCEAPM